MSRQHSPRMYDTLKGLQEGLGEQGTGQAGRLRRDYQAAKGPE